MIHQVPHMARRMSIGAMLILMMSAVPAAAQAPRVENVGFEFMPQDSIVVIQYDLIGEGEFSVDVAVSLDDGPFMALNAVQGNVGPGVLPGRRNTVTWDVYDDYPAGFTVNSIVFRVDAVLTDRPSSTRRIALFAGGGAAILGTAAALLLTGGGGDGGNGGGPTVLAAPPGRPPGN
ncbi:MAG: hypothetical protein HKN17_09960 [Rhodothermales bacterium]|nr:hypothetical protein [Rhodothermales bacterium]